MEESADLTDPQLWLSLSDDKLRTANKHLADGEYRDAVSDAYYAMFHVARAALASAESNRAAIRESHRISPRFLSRRARSTAG